MKLVNCERSFFDLRCYASLGRRSSL